MKRAAFWTGALVLGLAGAAAAAPDVRDLKKNLKRAVATQQSEPIQQVLEELIAAGGPDALDAILDLIPKLDRASDSVYWQLIGAASGFRDAAALEALGDHVVSKDRKPYTRDLVFGLENNTSPFVPAALKKILSEGAYDVQLMAADQLARVRTVEAVDALIATLEREGDRGDPELKTRCMTSLTAITGESMGDPLNWIGWWKQNRDKGLPDREKEHVGGGLASQTLDPNRAREFESLDRDPKRILVISAQLPDDDPDQPGRDFNYDHMEQVLTRMEIPHTVVRKKDFEAEPDKYLREAWTILVNCNNIQEMCVCATCRKNIGGHSRNRMFSCPPNCPDGHTKRSYRLPQQVVDKLKQWVEAGGYLFTEDWGLVEILDVAWPEIVSSDKGSKAGGGAQETIKLVRALNDKDDPESINTGGHMDVRIAPGRGVTSLPLMRGVFARPRPPVDETDVEDADGTQVRHLPPEENPAAGLQHQWTIDDESPAIHVQSREVTVLLESEELGKILANQSAGKGKITGGGGITSPVAINFRVGRGSPGSGGRDRPVTGEPRGRGAWSETLPGGSVLHCLSHFGKQQSNVRDTFVLQNLILNFIMESNRQHGR